MHRNRLGLIVAVAACFAGSASAAGEWAGEPARLEITLARFAIPEGHLVGWDLSLDGAHVAAAATPVEAPAPAWTGTVKPGPHTIALSVRYEREDMKTLVSELDARKVGFTFVLPGGRSVDQKLDIDARPGSLVRVAVAVEDAPEAIDDHLVVARGPEDGSWVEVGDRAAFRASGSATDPCLAGDEDRCMLVSFAKMFGGRKR